MEDDDMRRGPLKVGLVPALSQLAALEHVQVLQEAHRPFQGNKYTVREGGAGEWGEPGEEGGRELFIAQEKGNAFGWREMVIPVYDSQGQEVMQLRRKIRCSAYMEVWVQGELACVVRQKMTWTCFVLHIKDAEGHTRYRVARGFKCVCYNRPMDFQLQTADKCTIGLVRKELEGFKKTWSTRLDNYTLRFPADMDVRYKAGVIGASIMLDYVVFERH